MVANLTPLRAARHRLRHADLANNVLGLAPGPILTGRLADCLGLAGALPCLPVASLLAAAIVFCDRPAQLSAPISRPDAAGPSRG